MVRAVSDHPNAELARLVWDAIARGDADGLRAFLAPDLVWRATARGTPWAGVHRGADAAVDLLARVGEATDVLAAQLVDILASDARLLVLFHVQLAMKGRRVELDYLLLARVEDGRFAEVWTALTEHRAQLAASEVWTAPLDPPAIEAFWAGLSLAR